MEEQLLNKRHCPGRREVGWGQLGIYNPICLYASILLKGAWRWTEEMIQSGKETSVQQCREVSCIEHG